MGHEASILVTDDDQDMRLLFTTLLSGKGYTVWEATTGKGCLEAARSRHPDIVLLDVLLPDMTGVEVCEQIKAESELRDTFVILVSGYRVSSECQAEGLNVGADGYIVKGVTNSEFLARIQSLVRIKGAENALRGKEEEQRVLISELQKALAEIRTLKGLIPICSCCKKIRDDKGYWNQLESYIGEHTDAVFSHGICPTCAERLYPEYCGKK
jgi:sigma-B regulation protein RsbU (phosphoserine phosphatase)